MLCPSRDAIRKKQTIFSVLLTLFWIVSCADRSSEKAEKEDHRKLEWIFVPTRNAVRGQGWYDNYDENTVPSRPWKWSDEPDKLRSSDVCYDNGSFSRSHCPSPPTCNFKSKWGEAKLCINRVPTPDKSFFYVLVMKCIPFWENCDKCICGTITSERKNGYCKYKGQPYGDDWVDMNCHSLFTLDHISCMKRSTEL